MRKVVEFLFNEDNLRARFCKGIYDRSCVELPSTYAATYILYSHLYTYSYCICADFFRVYRYMVEDDAGHDSRSEVSSQ